MNDTCICENTPRVWRLTGVTRTLRLRIFNPDGTPLDLSGRWAAVTIARDNSEFSYAPGFVIEGDDNNVVKFEWPADKQGAGDYTINVTTTDGSGNVDRVNWHGPTGIRLVDFSFMVRGEDALGVTSEANIGLDGTFTMNGTGMSAYDEWLAEGHTGTPEDFIAWLRQPATDAASAAEAQMGQIQERADADHTRAEADHEAMKNVLPTPSTSDGGKVLTVLDDERNIGWDEPAGGNGEDINKNSEGKFQFANRAYNSQTPDGMGYKILRKNASFVSQVTEANTIYEIRYNFVLSGGSISLPVGAILRFVGGTLSNGTIIGNNSEIVSNYAGIFDSVNLLGTWSNTEFFVGWWKCVADGVADDGPILHSISATINANGGGKLVFPQNMIYAASIPTGPTDYGGRVEPYYVLDFRSTFIDVEMNGSTIKVLPNLWVAYGVFNFQECTFSLRNGKIEGDRLTRDYSQAYEDSGACNGIYVRGGQGKICDMELSQMPGNGFYIGNLRTEATAASVDVERCYIHNVRKNGAGVTGNKKAAFRGCVFRKIGTSDGVAGTSPMVGIDFEFEGVYKYGGKMSVIDCTFDECDKHSIMYSSSSNLGFEELIVRDCYMHNGFPCLELTSDGRYEISGLIIDGVGSQQGSILLPQIVSNCEIKNIQGILRVAGQAPIYTNVILSSDQTKQATFNLSEDAAVGTFIGCKFDGLFGVTQTNTEFPYVGGIETKNNKSQKHNFINCHFGDTQFRIQAYSNTFLEGFPLRFFGCVFNGTSFYNVTDKGLYFENCSLRDVRGRYQSVAPIQLVCSSLVETRAVDAEIKGGYGFGNNQFIASNSFVNIKQYSRGTSSELSVFSDCDVTITENNLSKTKKITVVNGKLSTNKPTALILVGDGIHTPGLIIGTTSQRPSDLVVADAGYKFFDTDLGKPIWYNGSGWVDATGVSV